ncbi:MAG TPA: MgtC/SapB family protein [Geminicoccaceae bacterium]|nr:MgtC/SapB family protein [Geminicoccaceae bacterium]
MPIDLPDTAILLEDAALRLIAAGIMGLLIGLDREVKHKPLGLKTNTLVAMGAAAFGLIVMELVHVLDRQQGLGPIDPSRVVQGIIEGIGFLGAGAIIRGRGEVIGATTGATIWVVGAIGLACGFGLVYLAGLITGLVLLVLVGLGLFSRGRPENGEA